MLQRSQAAHNRARDRALEKGNIPKAMYHMEMYLIQNKNKRLMPKVYREKVFNSMIKKYKDHVIKNGMIVKK